MCVIRNNYRIYMINVKPLKYHMSVGTTFLAILRSVKIQIGILAV